jgi:hypothetical protein
VKLERLLNQGEQLKFLKSNRGDDVILLLGKEKGTKKSLPIFYINGKVFVELKNF